MYVHSCEVMMAQHKYLLILTIRKFILTFKDGTT